MLPWEPRGLPACSGLLWTVLPATQATKVPSLGAFRFLPPIVPDVLEPLPSQPGAPGSRTGPTPLFCFKMPVFSKGMVLCRSPDQHGGDCKSPGGFWALRGHVSASVSQTEGRGFLVTQYGDRDGQWGRSLLTLAPGQEGGRGGAQVQGLSVAGAGPASSGTQCVPPSVSGPSLLVLGAELGLGVRVPGSLATHPIWSKHLE